MQSQRVEPCCTINTMARYIHEGTLQREPHDGQPASRPTVHGSTRQLGSARPSVSGGDFDSSFEPEGHVTVDLPVLDHLGVPCAAARPSHRGCGPEAYAARDVARRRGLRGAPSR